MQKKRRERGGPVGGGVRVVVYEKLEVMRKCKKIRVGGRGRGGGGWSGWW